MPLKSPAIWLWRFLFHRQHFEDELDEELRSCFEMLVERYVARGLTQEAARRTARIEFEGVQQTKEGMRDVFLGMSLETMGQDIRYAWRALRKTRGFTTIAIATLALGIGVNTAIFSVVYAALLKPLPYGNPEQLAMVWSNFQQTAAIRAVTSGPILGEMVNRNRAFQSLAGIWIGTGTFLGEDPEQVKLGFVTPNFFDTLSVRAALGRTFVKEEGVGGRPAIVVTDGLWRRRFGANPAIVGSGVRFQGGLVTVVGVLPPEFDLRMDPSAAADVEVFTPFRDNIYLRPRTLYFLRTIARLKPGVTIEQARQDLDRVANEIRGAYTEFAAEQLTFDIAGIHADAVREIRPAVIAMFAGAGFVLLICCVNVTSLFLARASDRSKEMALRGALGASRWRIIRQLLTEGLTLCAASGAIALAVAWAVVRGLSTVRPVQLARLGTIELNWPVLAFATAVSLGAVLLFGLVPAWESLRLDVAGALRDGARASSGPLHRRFGSALVVAEIAVGLVLVVGAGLTIRTWSKVREVQPGFQSNNLLTFQLAIGALFNSNAGALSREKQLEAHLSAIPGVEAVGGTSHLPLDDFANWYSPFRPEGKTQLDAASLLADYRAITPGYFAAMGTRLISGRYFDDQDRAGGRQVAIVDEMLARIVWPGQNAIGKRIEAEHVTNQGFVPVWSEVVGVVEHMRVHSLRKELRGEIYLPFEQSPRSPLSYAIRTRGDPLALLPQVRHEIQAVNPNLAMFRVRPMTVLVHDDMAPVSFTALLVGGFAVLALLLAALGIYGVLYYQVSRRMPEMGIRMALGASTGDVLRLVMRQGLVLTTFGVVAGIGGAVLAARYLRSLLYGVSIADPVTYLSALVLLCGAALLGCWRPARKAASANPVEAIRAE